MTVVVWALADCCRVCPSPFIQWDPPPGTPHFHCVLTFYVTRCWVLPVVLLVCPLLGLHVSCSDWTSAPSGVWRIYSPPHVLHSSRVFVPPILPRPFRLWLFFGTSLAVLVILVLIPFSVEEVTLWFPCRSESLAILSEEPRSGEVWCVRCLVAKHVSRFLDHFALSKFLPLARLRSSELLFEPFSILRLCMVLGSIDFRSK